MIKKVFHILILSTISVSLLGQLVDHDVYLLSNLCDVEDLSIAATSIQSEIAKRNTPTTIILNGDLVCATAESKQWKDQLKSLLIFITEIATAADTKTYILSGDRDWNNNEPHGYDTVIRLEHEINKHLKKNNIRNVEYLCNGGCPGPRSIELNRYTNMIAINSQWWNHRYKKPTPADATCEYIIDTDIAEEIRHMINDNENQNTLIVAHHPIRSLGNYGGRFSLLSNFMPLPIIGSFRNSFRSQVGDNLSIHNDRLEDFGDMLYDEIYYRKDIILASGHEKNQQIHKEIDNILVNSGTLQNGSYSPSDFSTIFHSDKAGYIRLEYKLTGSVSSTFINLSGANQKIALLSSACNPSIDSDLISNNEAYIPCVVDPYRSDNTIPDSGNIRVKPGKEYKSNWLNKIFFGVHHRPTWTTSVTAPIINLNRDLIDLTPYEIGGNRQTKTLKFKDQNGKRYTFRSVDKNPKNVLNYVLRSSIIGKVVEDQTSAQHPYGALVVAPLLEPLDILHVQPKLYVMPDIADLGSFRETYGGMLGMLEENPGKPDENGTYFGNAENVLQSNELFRKLFENKGNKISTEHYLRARLLDMLVGDWNRKEDNWKWAEYSDKEGNIYYPIPINRDHAFSKWDGLLPWLADREWGLSNIEGFDHKINGFRSQVYQARYLDRFLLTGSSIEEYLAQADILQERITDDIIRQAVLQMPREAYLLEGEEIIEKLKQRRDDMAQYAEKFYRWLSKNVEIVGSAKKDFFSVNSKGDSLVIEIWNDDPTLNSNPLKYYHRAFHSDETDLIRIYGLGDNDTYNTDISATNDIDIVLLGGEGSDTYTTKADDPSLEIVDEKEDIGSTSTPHITLTDNWHRKRYVYRRNTLQFDEYLPLMNIGYNNFNGVTLRSSLQWTDHRWDKPDFHRKQKIDLNLSSAGDYGIRYSGLLRHCLSKWDWTWKFEFANPDFFDAYFGQGNGSIIDSGLEAQDFYVTTYNTYSGRLGLRRVFWRESEFSVLVGYRYYVNKFLENTILAGEQNLLGANEHLSIIPLETKFELDFRDNGTFPSVGNRLLFTSMTGMITNQDYRQFSVIGISIEQYMSTHNPRPLTLALKVGGTKGFNDVPFYLQPRLGGNIGLRGYRSNRFVGRSNIYGNLELRWQINRDEIASIPYKFGFSTFYDVGKTSNTGITSERNNKFRNGYGFGIFLVPFTERFALSMYFSFSDENKFFPQFTFGSAIN